MPYLCDSNIIIDIFRNTKSSRDIFPKLSSEGIVISTITLHELYIGAFLSDSTQKNMNQIEAFTDLQEVITIEFNSEIAKDAGHLSAMLSKKGNPLPFADICIAATALTYNLTLLTRDKKHFEILKPYLEIEFID